MQIKKFFAGALTSAAFLTTLTFGVSAASFVESKAIDNPMNTSYSGITDNGVGYIHYYAGITRWYDYPIAYTETNLASGMFGYATVLLKADNNKTSACYTSAYYIDDPDYYMNKGCICTNNAAISGIYQADSVRFMGARIEKSAPDHMAVFDYSIYD